MKRLFSIKCDGVFFVEKENEVYSTWDLKAKKLTFFDNCGNVLPNYTRPRIEETDNSEELVMDEDKLLFNKYGVACANRCLVDLDGNEIPDTKLNLEESCGEYDRYFVFSMMTKEQSDSISMSGTAEGITVDIYDTKLRKYVAKSIPECVLDVSFYDGEAEVILAAIELLLEYDNIDVCKKGTIIGKKGGWITVYDFYSNDSIS